MDAPTLDKTTIIWWRQIAGDPRFQEAVMFLRMNHCPAAKGDTVAAIMEASLKWAGYQEALNDLTGVLTRLPSSERTLDEPPMEA